MAWYSMARGVGGGYEFREFPLCTSSRRMVLGRRDESRDGTTGFGVRVETHEAWLEDNRYLNMDLLAEQRRERQPDEALPHTKKEFAQLDGHNQSQELLVQFSVTQWGLVLTCRGVLCKPNTPLPTQNPEEPNNKSHSDPQSGQLNSRSRERFLRSK